MGAEANAVAQGITFTDDAERAYLNMAARAGNLIITSGHTSTQKGKLGDDVSVDQGYAAAKEVAEKIANLEVEQASEREQAEGFAASVAQLRKAVSQAEGNIKRLKQQVDTVKATESVQKAQMAVAQRYGGSQAKLQTAVESLERIKQKQAERGAKMEASAELAATSAPDDSHRGKLPPALHIQLDLLLLQAARPPPAESLLRPEPSRWSAAQTRRPAGPAVLPGVSVEHFACMPSHYRAVVPAHVTGTADPPVVAETGPPVSHRPGEAAGGHSANQSPGGRKEQRHPEGVGHESRGEHEGAGEQHQQAVHDLLPRDPSGCRLFANAPQNAQTLPLDQPGADNADQHQQADGVQHPGRRSHLDDDPQLHDGRDEEDQEQDEEHGRMLGRHRTRPSPGGIPRSPARLSSRSHVPRRVP